MKNSLLKYFLLVFFGLFLALLTLEISLRTIQLFGEHSLFHLKPIYTTIQWKDDPDIGKVLLKPLTDGYFVTPSKEYSTFIKVNSEGFYDDDHLISKKPHVFRILLLGDSFVQSFQFPSNNTISKQIEQKLKEKIPGKDFEVIALGMGDTGTSQQLLALQKYGLKYKPDLVIHMFFTANDVKNNYYLLQNDLYRPYFRLVNNNLELLPPKKTSNNFLTQTKDSLKNLQIINQTLLIRQKLSENQKNKESEFPADYQIYEKTPNQNYSNSWDITKKLILKSKYISEKNNSKYLLVTLANNEQVNTEIWSELKKTYPALDNQNIDLENPDKILGNFCKDQQLGCLFLLPSFIDFKKKNPNESTHYRLDGHWNEKGADIAANTISNYIKTNYFSIK